MEISKRTTVTLYSSSGGTRLEVYEENDEITVTMTDGVRGESPYSIQLTIEPSDLYELCKAFEL